MAFQEKMTKTDRKTGPFFGKGGKFFLQQLQKYRLSKG
ncbi:hypothetical protein B4100_0523 [Heyndrickxia coagulans]|nr:hypothetical protein B4100_0523 [Heyndrickxia coagulans]